MISKTGPVWKADEGRNRLLLQKCHKLSPNWKKNDGKYTLNLDGTEAVIETADVEIISEDIPGWLVANEGKLTVALKLPLLKNFAVKVLPVN